MDAQHLRVEARARAGSGAARRLLNKVPEVTLLFWVIKILCTTVGETVSDFLNADVGLGLATTGLVMGGALLLALAAQLALRKYVPWVYWLVVVLISIVGTVITDELHDVLGIDLGVLTGVFAVVLAAIFGLWFAVERTLSIRTIHTRRREGFYWATILATFALGTAAGDFLLETLQDGLGDQRGGLLLSGALFAVVIALAATAHLALKVNPILTFWIAYVFTRPLGANIGDLLGGDPASVVDDAGNPGVGGLGLGAPLVSAVFLAAILASIVYLTVTKKDAAPDP